MADTTASEKNVKLSQLTRFYSNLANKVGGLGLTHNDLTDALKQKYDAAQENVIESIKVNNTVVTPADKAVNITVPTKASDLENDSNFVSTDTSSLANYYDKSTIDTLESTLRGLITAAETGKLTKKKVSSLPAIEDAVENVIYLVPNTKTEGNNVFDEYLLIDGKLESMGTTKVEMDDYVLKKDLVYATDADIDGIFTTE